MALLPRHHPAQVQRIEVERLGAQHLVIEGLRAGQLALPVQVGRLLQ
jgi:hypothetical protein